jgi:hypothetical protein
MKGILAGNNLFGIRRSFLIMQMARAILVADRFGAAMPCCRACFDAVDAVESCKFITAVEELTHSAMPVVALSMIGLR